MPSSSIHIGLILFPNVTQLDLTGPSEVFSRLPGAHVHLLWKDLDPVVTERGMRILPTTRYDECPPLTVICVPGGSGQIELMSDQQTLNFLRKVAAGCQLITSVCTGSLILGAAGLLTGYRATSHWSSIDQLGLLGAEPVHARVVRDRDRLTGAGVTSGIDFALSVVALLAGEEVAQSIQLQMEYDPEPPFQAGSPRVAPPELVARTKENMSAFIERRRIATVQAANRV
ncbi:DJ-1/PfpI family protein [Pseudomonas silvicola]|nr:DJ-1/PfpI family protein [Pseudomonas silvicola]